MPGGRARVPSRPARPRPAAAGEPHGLWVKMPVGAGLRPGPRRPVPARGLAQACFGGMNPMARSASAVIVSDGFTPGFADTAEPSMT